jgi:hypothetical protein
VVACGGGKGNYSGWIEGEIRAMHEGGIVGAAAAPEGEGEKARQWRWMGEQVRGKPTRETACRTPEPLRAKMKRVFGSEPTHRLRAVLRERAATRRHACG